MLGPPDHHHHHQKQRSVNTIAIPSTMITHGQWCWWWWGNVGQRHNRFSVRVIISWAACLPACHKLPAQLDYISTSSSTEDNIMSSLPAPSITGAPLTIQTNYQNYHIMIFVIWGISRAFIGKKKKKARLSKKVVKNSMLKKVEKCTASRKKSREMYHAEKGREM